ncbi:hypothetical protein HQ545_03055 [Candidatus Woesearchaeota archaeon]|nr:hypothetical protein [Candidatus Woesearchaeota archaeon]
MRKTVKIQKKQISLKSAKTKRHIYMVTIPEKLMTALKWKEGTELTPQMLVDDVLVFKRVKRKV